MRRRLLALVLAVLLAMAASPSFAQAPGLVSYWPADGNFLDVVGGNNGTPVGGVSFAPGEAGSAFAFDGMSGRVFVPDSPSLAISGSIAMSAWVLFNGIPDGSFASQILFRGDDNNGLDPYYLAVNYQNYVAFHICNGPLIAEITGPIPLGTWTFVAASLDNNTGIMQLYVNGEVVAFQRSGIRPFADLDPDANPGVGIGNVQSGNYSAYFNGSIDEVRLYNTAGPTVFPAQLSLASSSVKGGTPINASVILDDAPFQSVTVSLKSDSAAVTVPKTIQIGYGQAQSAPFIIRTRRVVASRVAHLNATLNGVTVTSTLVLTP